MSSGPARQLREGLTLPVRRDLTGATGPTKKQAAGKRWRRTSRGFFVPSHVDREDVNQRIAEVSVVVPPRCGITAWAGLRWMGGRWFGETTPNGERRPVTIAIGTRDIRPQPGFGIAVTGEGLAPRMVIEIGRVRVTRPVWSVSFEMRYANGWRQAVVALDMAAYNDLVSIEEQSEFVSHQNGWTGVPQARKALPYGSENSWSPMETLMRLIWEVDAELPRPLCNVPIFDLDGQHLGTPDLLDPEAGLMGEYDGSGHLVRQQHVRDVRRAELLRSHDLESVIMLADDFKDPGAYITRLHRARRTAIRRQPPRRTWTIEPPWWWTPTITVEQRRALTQVQRERLLRHRSA